MTVEILVDYSNLFWRCASSMPREFIYGAEFGTLKSLLSLRRKWPDCSIRICHDNFCAWRRDVFPDYKGSRAELLGEPDLWKQEVCARRDAFKTVLANVLPQYYSEGSEADDVVAALRMSLSPAYRPETSEIVILSPDHDFHQLVEHGVVVVNPLKMQMTEHNFTTVTATHKVEHPFQLRWLGAYSGCSSDSVPGSGVPSKFVAEFVKGLHHGPGYAVNMGAELTQIEHRARTLRMSGWGPGYQSKLLNFHDNAIRNFKVMTLLPPRVASTIQCEYTPDFERFMEWVRETKMVTIFHQLEQQFGEPPAHTFLEKDILHIGPTHYQHAGLS